MAELPANTPWFDPVEGVGLLIIVAWFLIMFPTVFATQGVVQVSFVAKDAKTARKGFIIGGLIILPIGFLSAIFGIVAAAKFPGLENAAMALPKVVLSLDPYMAGLWTLVAGIIVLAMWQFIPAIRIVSHPIYLEWPVCIVIFLLVCLIDKKPASVGINVQNHD